MNAAAPASRRRVTMEDVAREAGVARGTVSRVLNGGSASPASRSRVEAAIEKTGYRANIHARSLASGRSSVYAAVLSEPYSELFEDPTFGRMLHGISGELVGTEIALNLLFATTAEERARTLRQLSPGRVDGVILLSPHLDDPFLSQLSADTPVVVCGDLPEQRANMWTATVDDHHGGVLGAEHLVERGCRRVVIIAGPDQVQGVRDRVAGQIQGLREALLPDGIVHASYSTAGGASAMRTLLERHPDVDGVLCSSDRQALGALSVLRESGRRIPEDIRVVGFDDHPMAASATPPLTTISQPITEVGATSARLLHSIVDGRPAASVVLPTRLVIRETT